MNGNQVKYRRTSSWSGASCLYRVWASLIASTAGTPGFAISTNSTVVTVDGSPFGSKPYSAVAVRAASLSRAFLASAFSFCASVNSFLRVLGFGFVLALAAFFLAAFFVEVFFLVAGLRVVEASLALAFVDVDAV